MLGPHELLLAGGVLLLLFWQRLLPKWGRALGETLGYVRGKHEDKVRK